MRLLKKSEPKAPGSITRAFRNMMNNLVSQLDPLRRHNTGLVLIAAYKLLQSLLFVAVGVGMLRLLHTDVGDLLAQLADYLRFDPESHVVSFLLDKASLLNDPMLRRISTAAFCYAGLDVIQAVGLYLEKSWGEYLTLGVTASFLPWEVSRVLHSLTWGRAGLLLINLLICCYILQIVVRRGKCRCALKHSRTET